MTDFYGPPAAVYYLNGRGTSNSYNVFRFGKDRLMKPVGPIIGPAAGNAGANVAHVAWPDAIQMNDRVRVYALRNSGGKWADIAYWDSPDGIQPYTLGGVVVSGHANGYGPATVYIVRGDARPYKMLVAPRESDGSIRQFRLHDSADGETFTDRGVVFTQTETWEAGLGITLGQVFYAPTIGRWVLAYSAYQTADIAHSALAFSRSPYGPFIERRKIFSPNVIAGTITAAAAARTNTIQTALPVVVGEPYLLFQTGGVASEPIRPVKVDGTTVYLDRPLVTGVAAGSEIAHANRAKSDVSCLWETPSGWRGFFTLYGGTGTLTEYTALYEAASFNGPWTIVPDSPWPYFEPWHPDTRNSCENPTPLLDAVGLF